MSQSDSDREFQAISPKDIFEEARDRLEIANQAEARNRVKAKYDLAFREGDQWDREVITTTSQENPELTINLTDAWVTRVENNIRQQRPRGKCHPVGNGADIDTASVINGLGRHVEMRSNASIAYDTAAKHALTMGWGYFRLITEYVAADSFQQELRILPIFNPFSVYLDPGAIMPTGEDAAWGLISIKEKRQEFKRKHPKASNASWEDTGSGIRVNDWESKEEIRLAEYFRIRETEEKLFLIRSAQGEEYTKWESDLLTSREGRQKLDDVVPLLAARGLMIDGDRLSSKRQLEWFQLNGEQVVDRRRLFGEFIPIVRVTGNCTDIDGDIYRRGMVRNMIDPQRMVNYGEVAKIKRLGLAPKSQWVAAEGQLDGHEDEWADSNRSTVAVLTYKPVTVSTAQGDQLLERPTREQPAGIEAGFSEFVQGMRTNLLAVTGMPNEPGADAQAQVISGKAIRQRDKLSDQSHFQYYDNLTLSIAYLWRIMLQWYPHVYNEQRMQRIIGEDGAPSMVMLNQIVEENGVRRVKNDLSVGRYDVIMDTGPGYETKREEGAEALLELLSVGPLAELIAKVGADLVIRSIDHPYMQELADRIAALTPDGLKKVLEELPERARSLVQAMAAENHALQQQIQQLQADLKYKLTGSRLAAETKAHDTETNAETRRFDTLVRAHTALGVEEIKAGASLMNTKGEAAAHPQGAREIIAGAEKAEKGAA